MSKKIIGSEIRINRLRRRATQKLIKKIGKEGIPAKVSSKIEAIVNRPTKIATLETYLQNGFDFGKFNPIIVAEFPDGSRKLLDGDHRRHMWRLMFGDNEDISAYIVNVYDEAEYHRLFAAINKENRKNCTAEETFLHQYLGFETEAIKTANSLFACNLAVEGSPDDPIRGYVGNKNHPLVSIGGFRTALNRELPNVQAAASTITNAWNDRKVMTELLDGLALVYKTYPVLRSKRKGAKLPVEFNKWFSNYLNIQRQKDKAKDWKTKGGNVHHMASESIARGMVKEFRDIKLPGGVASKKQTLPLTQLDALFEKDKK